MIQSLKAIVNISQKWILIQITIHALNFIFGKTLSGQITYCRNIWTTRNMVNFHIQCLNLRRRRTCVRYHLFIILFLFRIRRSESHYLLFLRYILIILFLFLRIRNLKFYLIILVLLTWLAQLVKQSFYLFVVQLV